jgi:group I intron endonuclease
MEAHIITNTINGKSYCDKTITTFEKRWKQHLVAARRGSAYPFHRAIRKYGPTAFVVQILTIPSDEEFDDEHILNEWEKFLIEGNGTFVRGYNLTFGGDGASGHVHSEQTRRKISEAHRGQQHALGRKMLAKTRFKISQSLLGRSKGCPGYKFSSEALLRRKGNRHAAKLPLSQVADIRRQRLEGHSSKALAVQFGVSRHTIDRVVRNLACQAGEP